MAFLEILEKKKKSERKKERRRGEETKPKKLTSFGERKGDLAFLRVHIIKNTSEGQVRSSLSVYNK